MSLSRSTSVSAKVISGIHNIGGFVPASAASSKVVAVRQTPSEFINSDSLQSSVQKKTHQGIVLSHGLSAKGINVNARRLAHTDVTFPDMEKYRHGVTQDTDKAARDNEDHRKALPVALYYGAGGVMSLWAGKEVVQTLVIYKAMAADQRALASIEINMSDVPEGQTKTFEWRGKPVFVKHRTKNEIAREKAVVVGDLRHPEHDDERVKKDEWSVVIGVCTHLGCVPISGAGDFGGYYCPCHGSHYDGSGRIRKGPAPLNLPVPAYSFKDTTIVIGA